MVINTVGHLAESAWHHPDITASYAWVEVRLQNHAAKGITDKDFELAKKIEDVVHWQPGKEEDRSRARRGGSALRLYQVRQIAARRRGRPVQGKRKWATPGSTADPWRCTPHSPKRRDCSKHVAPVVAGLGVDIAGARAAIALAQRLGAAVDHMHSDAVLRDLAVMRGAGMMVTTPNVVRLTADVVLLIGAGLLDAWPELPERLLAPLASSPAEEGLVRRIIRLCPGRDPARSPALEQAQMIGRGADGLPVLLAALRARVAGRAVGKTRLAAKVLDTLAADLRAARFGVAVWSAAELDALTIEMLCGLVDDLNAATRFSGLSLAPGDNALGVLQTCGWMTGFPMRTGFARGHPEHDPGAMTPRVSSTAARPTARSGFPPTARRRRSGSAVADDRAHGAGSELRPRAAGSHRGRPPWDRPRRGRALPAQRNARSDRGDGAEQDHLGRRRHLPYSRGAAVRRSVAVLTRIKGGRVVDPANGRDGVGDVWFRDGRIVDAPAGDGADDTYDAAGKVVMAGAIDIHSHIAGSNVNTARLLMPELQGAVAVAASDAAGECGLGTFATGCRYAGMGFTTVVEPAVAPDYALHAHLELADIPIIDKATLSVLGNDDYLLSLMRASESASAVRDYVAWTLATSRALGIKVINAGGAVAFKANMREFSLDDVVPFYGVSSRAIVKTLQRAVHELGVPHPLRALQQSRSRRQRRHRARHHRGGGGPAAPWRTCSSTATARKAAADSPRPRRASPRR